MPSPPRRSGRSRKANAKYANAGWNKETLRLLRESSESSNPTSVDTDEEQSQHDDEFDENELQKASPEAEVDDDDLSVASGLSKSSHVATPREEEDNNRMSLVGSDDERGNIVKKSRWKQPAELHSRGLGQIERAKTVKDIIWRASFGPELDDLYPMLKAKERWITHARDVTLPSFVTLDETRLKDWLGENNEQHTTTGSFATLAELLFQQKLEHISVEEARRRQFFVGGASHRVVSGPWSKQQEYELSYLKPFQLGQAWQNERSVPASYYHSGWLLNVGEKPQSVAWCSGHNHDQYLALACRTLPEQRQAVLNLETTKSPAFSPSAEYPSSIQIWRFAVKNNREHGSKLDPDTTPTLSQLLACKFGDIKQMVWVPSTTSKSQTQSENSLGILTVLTTDGHIRLVHIPMNDSTSNEPICTEVITPMLDLKPPHDSIFTCFTFASSTDLVVGTSSGHLHIYNIATSPTQDEIKPYFSLQTHQTYIMSVCSVGTAELSHFIVSASAAGALQLLDLRSPTQDILTLSRARLPTRNLIYNPHCRSFLTTVDSSGNTEPRGNAQTTLLSHNLRHFYSTTALSKTPEGSGTATALAGSQLHPFVLLGNTGGTVWAQNAIRRVLPMGRTTATNDNGAWVQKLIEYEWIPQPRTPASQQQQREKPDFHNGPPVRPGISRISLGFKPEKLDLSNLGSKKRKVTTSGLNGETAVQVIFEEEQAVTAMEWNSNPDTAAWCAIAWGSGVVLVTDLGHDAK